MISKKDLNTPKNIKIYKKHKLLFLHLGDNVKWMLPNVKLKEIELWYSNLSLHRYLYVG